MIRKAIIVVLTLGALTFGVVGMATRNAERVQWDWKINERHYVFAAFWPGTFGVGFYGRVDKPTAMVWAGRSWMGFSYWHTSFRTWSPKDRHAVSCPYWAPVVLLALYPSVAFIRGPVRRWQRHRKGLCPKCAYDLTGNESGVCPECGKPT